MIIIQRLWNSLLALARRWGGEPIVLLCLLVVVGGAWVLIEIADDVTEGETQQFDEWMVRAMRQADDPAMPLGPPWVQELGRDATALGGVAWLVFFTLVVAGYLWLDKKHHMVVFLLVAASTGLMISIGLKSFFDRPRPSLVPHLSHVSTSSFPSGHSMLSSVVYLTLGVLLASVVSQTRLKIYVIAVALLLSVIIGISRVYLGVHYPTDVLAGWMAGIAWALLCWLLARWLQRRGTVENPEQTTEQLRQSHH
jgi:undecaprenyl-diphosphatase